MNYLLPQRLDALARDYATGTLAGPARRRFERLLREQPEALRAVAAWQQRLSVLAAGVPAMVPRDAVWAGLQQRLFERAAAPVRPSWWQALWSGRVLGGALGGVIAGAMLCVLVLRLQPDWAGLETYQETLPASYVGLLTDDAGRPRLLASSRRHARTLTVKLLQPLAAPAGQVAQLWALPRGGGAPLPVGVLPAAGSSAIVLVDSAEKTFFGVDRLAVSFEPAAALPGGQPSTAYLLSGHCVRLW